MLTLRLLAKKVLSEKVIFFNWRIIALHCCLPDPHPTHPLVITEHQGELPALHSNFPLLIYFTHDSVYMSVLLSQFTLPPTVSIHLFSISTSPFLPYKQVHLYHFSRFHIYALIYNICFSLSELVHSV